MDTSFILIKRTVNKKFYYLNTHAPSSGVPNFIIQVRLDLKAQIKTNQLILDYFNTPLPPIDR